MPSSVKWVEFLTGEVTKKCFELCLSVRCKIFTPGHKLFIIQCVKTFYNMEELTKKRSQRIMETVKFILSVELRRFFSYKN